jgi:conjugative transfer region protein TrbK
MTGQQLDAEMQRCRALGLKSYDDPSCKAALQENRDRFLGKSGGSR